MNSCRTSFFALADRLAALLAPNEQANCTYSGEDSDFVRLNHARVRQAGHVKQAQVGLDLIQGKRHATGSTGLSGDESIDGAALASLLHDLRAEIRILPEDPHLLLCEDSSGTISEEPSHLPDSTATLEALASGSAGLDVVGLWAAGAIHRGFSSTFGQRSWHTAHTFSLDWSCHIPGDRAVRCSYAGTAWDDRMLQCKLNDARHELEILSREPRIIPPGHYRAYLAPAALADLLQMLNWGGFSCKAQRTGRSPLMRLVEGTSRLHPQLALSEDRGSTCAPAFTADGFHTPLRVDLMQEGRLANTLISPRSAREFSLTPNSADESSHNLTMAAGDLDIADVLSRLGTGLWINDLWYTNFSDLSACRITGMTRFACFWVEGGELVAPIGVMRFDESMYQLLGPQLIGITRQRELMPDNNTYGGRSLGGSLLPGILVGDLTLTL